MNKDQTKTVIYFDSKKFNERLEEFDKELKKATEAFKSFNQIAESFAEHYDISFEEAINAPPLSNFDNTSRSPISDTPK